MNTMMLMILAFLMLTSISLLWCRMFHLNLMEGMFLACTCVSLVLQVAAGLSVLNIGMLILYGFSIAGILYFLIEYIFYRFFKKSKHTTGSFRPVLGLTAYITLSIIFVISIILYSGDFIQHIDELHQWALLPKYLYEYGHLPTERTMVSMVQSSLSTSFFHYYFQRIAGYNEGMMYVSASLFYWVGFLLPFSSSTTTNTKRVCCYSIIIYLALYSLYIYGNKNLYVDIPIAAWTGGIIAWLAINQNASLKKHLLLLVPSLYMVFNIKKSIGWMAALIILLFFLLLIIRKRHSHYPVVPIVLSVISCIYTLLVSGLLYICIDEERYYMLPSVFRDKALTNGLSNEKFMLTLSSYINDVVCTSLTSGHSSLYLSMIFLAVICGGLLILSREYSEDSETGNLLLAFCPTILYLYLSAVFFGFLFLFSYQFSTQAAGSQRYLSIIGIIIFELSLSYFLTIKMKTPKIKLCGALILMILFASGINRRYLADTTSWNPEGVNGYADITEIRRQSEEIQRIINPESQVFFIDQNPIIDEFAVNAATYYMSPQLSYYKWTPWKYLPHSSIITLEEYPNVSIDSLPDFLTIGEFSYVWIYNSDTLLKEKLRELFEMDEDVVITKGQLYAVRSGFEKPLQLQLVKNLVTFDDIRQYEESN